MPIRFLIVILSFIVPVSATMADRIATTSGHPGVDTNPQIELYPGVQEDLTGVMEVVAVHKIKKLLEMLQSLRSDDVGTVIKMLEMDLKTESEALQRMSDKNAEVKEILKSVEAYNRRFIGE